LAEANVLRISPGLKELCGNLGDGVI
jgi:hypothetical protein